METGKLGITKVAIKSREYLAAVKPDGLFLILELMHFAQEVLEPGELKSAGQDVAGNGHDADCAMIANWEPTKYQDHYQSG